jgi:hypothetical protein
MNKLVVKWYELQRIHDVMITCMNTFSLDFVRCTLIKCLYILVAWETVMIIMIMYS